MGESAILTPDSNQSAQNPFADLEKRLSQKRLKAPKTTKNKTTPKTDVTFQTNSISQAVLKKTVEKSNAPAISPLPKNNLSRNILLTAQQYAQEEAQKHAHKAAKLIRKSVEDMETAMDVVGQELPFAEGKDISRLLEGYRAATAEMRKALGLVEDAQSTGPRTLVQIQCVGDVTVSGPTQDAAPTAELPDFE